MIANGAFSPLEGFMCETTIRPFAEQAPGFRIAVDDSDHAIDEPMRSQRSGEGSDIALYSDDHLLGVLHLRQKFRYDKQAEAERVYLTEDLAHPGVRALFDQGDWLLGGPISLLNRRANSTFPSFVSTLNRPGRVQEEGLA
jgi:sulfate adenylyltransferase